ncbi:MAG: LLM class flavin-dependent oxidoreductase [Proteobacteria bacterium]|nr:LLM class flavin-dependent oxidoreductase [Pseudomonadota bacterium]MDA1357305.1 LLM class flavin-dependent oxidoreductase [Pseudomonadota bacterium]
MIEFSLFNLMGFRARGAAVSDILADTVSLVQHAEDRGFDAAWFAEHHFSNYCICPSPLLMVSHCAGLTSRIHLGPAVIVVPLYQPVRLLEEIGMAAGLCGGRLQLGIGSGYQPFEFDRFGIDLDQSKNELDEFIHLMDEAYASETFTFDGRFTSLPETSISTRPAQMPPIWIAGDSEATHRLSARRGYTPIITGRGSGPDYLGDMRARIDSSYVAEGLSATEHPLGILRFACVTESATETEAYLENVRYQLRLAGALRNRGEAMERGMMAEAPIPGELSLEELAQNLPVGDSETVAARLLADIKASGASHVMLNIQAGNSTMAQARRTIDAFESDIRPAIERALN